MDVDLMQQLDKSLEISIQKLRNATSGSEIRTFVTEYEELMLKKSIEVTKEFLKQHK